MVDPNADFYEKCATPISKSVHFGTCYISASVPTHPFATPFPPVLRYDGIISFRNTASFLFSPAATIITATLHVIVRFWQFDLTFSKRVI